MPQIKNALLRPLTAKEVTTSQGTVLHLFLNTPGSNVNVFARPLAEQVHEIYDRLAPNTRLVVFRSSKPYSFLNGAELILTQAIKSLADVHALTSKTKAAYDKVAFAKVPTLSAIQGNCFGCGVEFTLSCDYRFAAKSYDTRFYMTELRDYFLLPLFGSLQKLPRLVGLKNAADLLVRGKVWDAEQALKGGLIDRALSANAFDQELDAAITELLPRVTKRNLSLPGGRKESHQETKKIHAKFTRWIQALPPEQHALHEKCLEILTQDNEIASAPENLLSTLSTEASRQATTFFFTRTMARVANLGTSEVAPAFPFTVTLPESLKGSTFANVFEHRILKEVRLEWSTSLSSSELKVSAPKYESFKMNLLFGFQEDLEKTANKETEFTLYFPLSGACELISHSEKAIQALSPTSSQAPLVRSFCLALGQLGLLQPGACVVVSPRSVSLLNPYLKAFRMQVEALSALGQLERLEKELREFGFEHSARHLYFRIFGRGIHSPPSVATPKNRKHESRKTTGLLADFLGRFLDQGTTDLKSKRLKNSAILDVLMNSVLGFPLSKGSFFTAGNKILSPKTKSALKPVA